MVRTMSQLDEVLEKLNYAKTLHWKRLCEEQHAMTAEEKLKLAEEVLSWPPLDTGAASQSAWLHSQVAKSITVNEYLKKADKEP